MRKRYQLSTSIKAVCSVPLFLLAVLVVAGGVAAGGLVSWLGFVGGALALVVVGRSWVLRVDDLGDKIRVVNWLRTVEMAWSEVERFEFDGAVAVRRYNASTVNVSAFSTSSRDVFGIAERRNEEAFMMLEATRKRRRRQARSRGDR